MGVALLIIAIISFASYHSTAAFLDSSNQIVAALNARHKARNVLVTMDDLETGTRGFALTGNEQFLEPYKSALTGIDEAIAQLASSIDGVPDLKEALSRIKQMTAEKLVFSSRVINERRAQGVDAAAALMKGGEGKHEMDSMRQDIGGIVQYEEELAAHQTRNIKERAVQTRWINICAGVFSILFVASALVVIHRDLKEKQRAEEQLRQNEERFRIVVEGAREYAIFRLDPEGRVQSWNAGAERIKGYKAEEIIGQHFSRFHLPEEVAAGDLSSHLKTALEKGQFQTDAWRVRKDGSRFWANVVITPLHDSKGKHIGFSKITRDLTDRKLAEEQLHNFFTLSLDMLCVIDQHGYFKRINPSWSKILGFSETELLAKPYAEFLHPDDVAASTAAAEEVAKVGSISHFQNRYRCRDGQYRWLMWTAALSSDGQRLFASARDITVEKGNQEEIAALNKALLAHNNQLESINKELEAFSYSVSHDLRAPLRSLDGFSQALLEDCSEKLGDEDLDHLQRIRAASQRMGQLIDDLLNLSRLTRAEINREPVDLSKMARETAAELQDADAQREVELVIADGLLVEADPRLLRIVLTNLLANAWKFTAKKPHSRIELGCEENNGEKEYFIRDNGVGFDMEYAGKLFSAFQRLHGMKEFPGTGIGLAIVQRIVNRHGGRIWAESAVDAGATFRFTV